MGAYALVGVRLGDYTAQCGIAEVDKFIVLDLLNLSKIEVDLKFLREKAEYFCVADENIDYDEFGLLSTGIFKNKIYASESEFCCCDSEDDLDKRVFDAFDFLDNGVVIVNNNIIDISEEQLLVYQSFTDKLCIVYKPYTDETEMCYRDSIVETNEVLFSEKYSVFYSVGSNLEFARHLDNASDGAIIAEDYDDIITLYSDYVLDTFYNCAECRDNVFRIGNVHWVDERIEQDTFIVENGCQAFFIIAESINANELVLPPSIKVFGCSDEACLNVDKIYLSKALKGSEVADRIENYILDIEYY